HDPFHRRQRAVDSGVVGDLGQQGRAADVTAVADRLDAVGGVDHQLHAAILHRIHDMRPAFEHFVDLGGGDAVLDQIFLRAAGSEDGEAAFDQVTRHVDDKGLVGVAYRDEGR